MSFFDFPIYQPAQDLLDLTPSPIDNGALGIFVYAEEYSEAEQTLLSKILGATGNDLAKINVQTLTSHQTLSLQSTWHAPGGLDVIFGIAKDQLMLQCEAHMYYPIQVNQRTLLFCDSLTILSSDAAKKKALWGCLKAHFKL